jgi:hypothetical protein
MSDIAVTAGNTATVTFELQDADGAAYSGSLDGAVFRWTARQRNGSLLTKRTDSGTGLALDDGAATVALSLTVAETRSLPMGKVARYQLEYLADGEEITVARAFINVTRGDNADG